MTLERILLQTIRFDLQVEHPYSYLIKYAKSLKGRCSPTLSQQYRISSFRLLSNLKQDFHIFLIQETNQSCRKWFKWPGHLSMTGK